MDKLFISHKVVLTAVQYFLFIDLSNGLLKLVCKYSRPVMVMRVVAGFAVPRWI